MNIFEVISSVTRRIEPFHSEFLSTSLRTNKKFRNQFLDLILPENLKNGFIDSSNNEILEIKSEDVFQDKKRIDIIIKDKNSNQIIGIEVKTSESSITVNQLSSYLEGMKLKYTDYNIYIVYLTPYNQENIPEKISPDKVPSICEFLEFNNSYNQSIHINWGNVVKLYSTNNADNYLYGQHSQYIMDKIIDDSKLLNRIESIERNRGFSEFIGDETFYNFISFLNEKEISYDDIDNKFAIHLNKNEDKFTNIIKTIEILFLSESLNKGIIRKDEVNQDLIDFYTNTKFKDFS